MNIHEMKMRITKIINETIKRNDDPSVKKDKVSEIVISELTDLREEIYAFLGRMYVDFYVVHNNKNSIVIFDPEDNISIGYELETDDVYYYCKTKAINIDKLRTCLDIIQNFKMERKGGDKSVRSHK